MRQLLVFAALVSVLTVASAAQDQRQRFRSGVDLITVDVAAVDSKGRPVEDLKPGDFVVKVDGKARPTVSAELIKVERGKPVAPSRPVDALITSNAAPKNVRRIIVAVDQTLITPGSIAPLQKTAREFIGRLSPDDYAAFVVFPEPGPRIDFTTDKTRVQKVMEQIVGQTSKLAVENFEMSLTEAIEIGEIEFEDKSDPPSPATREQILSGPIMRRVLERGCRMKSVEELTDPELLECRRDVYREARAWADEARLDAVISVKALEQLLRDLAALDGPKSMIMFSGGLVNDNPLLLDEIAQLAAAARTTINVIAVDRDQQRLLGNLGRAGRALINVADRSLERQGLEIIADSTGGSLYPSVGGTSEGVFQRIESELSAWYLLAVERQPGDPDQQRIAVEIKRKGVTVRSNKTFVSTASINAKRSMEDVLRDALSSSMTIPGLPLRVATFVQRDADSGKYRLRLAAQVGQPGEKPGEFAIGYALMGENGRTVTAAGSRRTLNPPAGSVNEPLQYESAITADPGVYALRVGVVDRDGRRGTVVHRVELPAIIRDEIGTSDLIVGTLPGNGQSLIANVEPQVTTGELAAYLELYLTDADRDRVTVTLELAEGESSPALAAEPLSLRPAEQPSWRVATGYVDVAATPGRYIARAIVRRDGVVVRTLSRAITIVRDPAVVARTPPRQRGLPISAELQQRTAAYVAGMVNGLANLVAQEDFTLSKPDRRVRSDLLLVQYPGTRRDLIPYRDVSHVNDAALPGRRERLVDLFVKPPDRLRERATRIMNDADAYVPTMFNPMFVLGFLQSDFQKRFELTVSDAGPEWPREVKAVAFVETVRPTLLRTGAFGDIDVPSRGVAWIEEGTGRVLQTELQIGRSGSSPTMVTKFRVDDRLQVTVPVEMRTKNPDGVATYTNFRRFGVETTSQIPPPPNPK